MKLLIFLIPLLIIFACNDKEQETPATSSLGKIDTLIFSDTIKEEDIAEFNIFKSKAFTPELPYTIDEPYLQSLNYNDYKRIPDSLVASYIVDKAADADYYLVAKPFDKEEFTSLIILESRLDTSYTTSDKFYLYTFTPDGYVISNIIFASSVSDNKHYKTLGILTPDMQARTDKFEFYLKNGVWAKKKQPIKTVFYNIDHSGQITITESRINIEEDEKDRRVI